MIKLIDKFLNGITMYRIVLYGLLVIIFYSVVLGFLKLLPYSGLQLLCSAILLTGVCFVTNFVFSKIYKAAANIESFAITALILFCLFSPATTLSEALPLVLGAIFAMGSKYIFAFQRKHIFNPAAFGAFLLGILGSPIVYWWIATPIMFPVVTLVGLLMVRKIRQFSLVLVCIISAVVSIYVFRIPFKNSPFNLLSEIFLSWPLVFFATVMVTEPLTSPPTQRLRLMYGSLVGILFGAQFHIGPLFSTPEFALLTGNIFSYLLGPKQKLTLFLEEKKQLAPQMYDFVFRSNQKLHFKPGQYVEWTLVHKRTDSRGNRRYFTIASSPTESEIHLGARLIEKGSSFKKALLTMEKDSSIFISQLGGDFVLPDNKEEKLVFIAGGIGITPFRSMIQYLRDTKQKRDIVLFYVSPSPKEFIHQELFKKASLEIGLKTIYVITSRKNVPPHWLGKVGYITEHLIKDTVIDYTERTFYLSGPEAMVDAYKKILLSLGIKQSHIMTDYFPGF